MATFILSVIVLLLLFFAGVCFYAIAKLDEINKRLLEEKENLINEIADMQDQLDQYELYFQENGRPIV